MRVVFVADSSEDGLWAGPVSGPRPVASPRETRHDVLGTGRWLAGQAEPVRRARRPAATPGRDPMRG